MSPPIGGDSVAASRETSGRSTRLCENLLRGWDPMFSRTIDPTRIPRTTAIISTLAQRPSGPCRILELGSGPGPLTKRMLERFPKCRVVALDTDPALIRVGEVALRRLRERTTWVLADLRKPDWPAALPFARFDAAVSSLTLHWLEVREIRAVYRALHELVRPRGVVIEGDFLPTPDSNMPLKRPNRGTARSRTSGREPRELRGPGRPFCPNPTFCHPLSATC